MGAVTMDLEFMGESGIIAAFLVPAPEGGFVLLECGPGSTVPALERGIEELGFELGDLRAVFVTHVHLDHAGAAGELARRTGARVYVHPRGAPHLADPSRLLASAERLYGGAMDFLWGTMAPVPGRQLHTVEDGEVVQVGGLEVTGRYTPGHASHHIAWQVGDEVATGDVGGLRMTGSVHVMPPTPPPDIDVPLWLASLDVLRGMGARRLLVTHFGAHDRVEEHIERLAERLQRWWELTDETLSAGGDAGSLEAALTELDDRELAAASADDELRDRYRAACPMPMNAAGLVRAWERADSAKGV